MNLITIRDKSCFTSEAWHCIHSEPDGSYRTRSPKSHCKAIIRLVLVLPIWHQLTRIVPDKIQDGQKIVVCVCYAIKESSCNKPQKTNSQTTDAVQMHRLRHTESLSKREQWLIAMWLWARFNTRLTRIVLVFDIVDVTLSLTLTNLALHSTVVTILTLCR